MGIIFNFTCRCQKKGAICVRKLKSIWFRCEYMHGIGWYQELMDIAGRHSLALKLLNSVRGLNSSVKGIIEFFFEILERELMRGFCMREKLQCIAFMVSYNM